MRVAPMASCQKSKCGTDRGSCMHCYHPSEGAENVTSHQGQRETWKAQHSSRDVEEGIQKDSQPAEFAQWTGNIPNGIL